MTLKYTKSQFVCKIIVDPGSLQHDLTIVEWMHNGNLMHYEAIRKIGSMHEVVTSTSHDNGWYQCIVKNDLRVLGIGSTKLDIDKFPSLESPRALPLQSEQHSQRSPYFIYISPDQRISVGGSTKLKCIAAGNPLPRLAWRLNGKVLVSDLLSRFMMCVLILTLFSTPFCSLRACEASMEIAAASSIRWMVWPQRPRDCIHVRRKILSA